MALPSLLINLLARQASQHLDKSAESILREIKTKGIQKLSMQFGLMKMVAMTLIGMKLGKRVLNLTFLSTKVMENIS